MRGLALRQSHETGPARRRLTEATHQMAERAEALKDAYPELPQAAIAARLGVSPRALRTI